MRIAPAVRVSAARAAVLGVTTVALLATGATMASAAPADHHRSRHFAERHNNIGEHRHHQYEHKRIEIWRGRDDDRSHDHGFCREFNNEMSSGWDDEGDFGGDGRNCRDGVRGEGHEGDHAANNGAAANDAAPAKSAPAASAPAASAPAASAPAASAPAASAPAASAPAASAPAASAPATTTTPAAPAATAPAPAPSVG